MTSLASCPVLVTVATMSAARAWSTAEIVEHLRNRTLYYGDDAYELQWLPQLRA